ncbi:MAG: ABC transporter permease [Bryobacterales bacterium]|nr:ABC transporter permease [Bryobacterales bacterium]
MPTPAETKPGLFSGFANYKDLLLMLMWRDVTIRYKQAVMGFAWALLMPVLIVGSSLVITVGYASFTGRAVKTSDILALAVRAIPWAFVSSALRFATNSLTANKELVTKIYFPRQILPLATTLASLFDFGVAAAAMTIILALVQIGVSVQLLWVPVLLLILVLLALGAGLLLACGNLFFRDVKYLVDIGLTYGIFFTPVFYSPSMMGKYAWLVYLNPLSSILDGLCRVVIYQMPPEVPWVAYSAGWAVVLALAAWKIFSKAEPTFAERI